MSFLMILARQAFPWDALSIAALSHATWHIGAIGIALILILLWRLPKRRASRLGLGPKDQFDVENEAGKRGQLWCEVWPSS
jgi:hypothetical protein